MQIYINSHHVIVRVKWYYRPEKVVGGRRKFHRVKEVFISDHFDVQSAGTIEGTCMVYGFKGYTKLGRVGDDEYFCRFEYASEKGEFIPDSMCEMPYNPDDLMVQCDGCRDWFHPACIDMNVDGDKRMKHFFYQSCLSDEPKITSHATSRHAVMKVDSKLLRR
ncbi:chromatin remodeling protein SHL-like protein [Tanacetum coccineum]